MNPFASFVIVGRGGRSIHAFWLPHLRLVRAVRGLLVSLVCCAAGAAWAASAGAITTASLIEEMTSLAGLAEFPSPAYTCKQFSSYDPQSKSPTEEWFANNDAGHYLRKEQRAGREEHVMADMAGPGALVRVWSANPAGTLRIYLDGAEEPVIEAAMSDLLGGKYPGFPRPIAGEYSKGWNLYFPIPYARSCKVTSDKGGFYYHVNYRTYPEGTSVETFQRTHLEMLAPRIKRLAAQLDNPRAATEAAGQVTPFDLIVGAGDQLRQAFYGPAAITQAVLRVQAADRETALRGLVLKVTFDGQAAIESPLGDFFGSAPGMNPYASLPLGMTKDGELYCHWLAPFQDSAVIELVNHSGQEVSLSGEITVSDYRWTEASMHLHAKWRAEFDVPTRPMQDWNYLTAKGQRRLRWRGVRHR